jgi:23S rRNA (pseudouridine1915-N3)-methyltransferase
MAIRIIAVGKKHESWVADGIERYQKRLVRPFNVEWVYLPHSAKNGLAARQDESERIIARLGDEYVVLLDERGQNIDSPNLSRILKQPLDQSKAVTVIIGGAYGVDDSIHKRADFIWSLSKLVFPHQLVRLILVEQLYRAQEITRGNPYHHE